MNAYYNENDPRAAQWLAELIRSGHIASGDVDTRSIVDVRADDVRGYTQCHFFAGIGGWAYALRLAGWPDDRPVWTGSCPCQPFSVSGLQRGSEDERHLWHAWFRLINECKPSTIFGEQVAGASGLGWLDHVCADLEGIGYAAASADLPACSVGAPHIRRRCWFVADTTSGRQRERGDASLARSSGHLNGNGFMGKSERPRLEGHAGNGNDTTGWPNESGPTGTAGAPSFSMAHAECNGRWSDEQERRSEGRKAGFWADSDWLECTDGKARPVEPGTFPLAYGIPGRVGLLRGYGNAIVPQVAAEFIQAYCDVTA